jgi:hypothetical protein
MGGPVYGRADRLELGTWNVDCSMCGRKRKANELVRNWQGLYRCPEHDEPRQPQDFAKGVPEEMGVPYAQVLSNNDFVHFCSINTRSAIPSYTVPGCCIPGNAIFDPFGV